MIEQDPPIWRCMECLSVQRSLRRPECHICKGDCLPEDLATTILEETLKDVRS